MRVISLNVGQARPLSMGDKQVWSGIVKTPTGERRHVGVAGLAGDDRVEPRKFGDENHALYAYPLAHYGFWEQYLGRESYEHGRIGENLTVSGPFEVEACLGDVLRIGAALVQVVQPRIPCRKLSVRMGGSFAGTFLRSRRVGYYLKVLEPGELGVGDELRLEHRDPNAPTIDELVRVTQLDYGDSEALQRLLAGKQLLPGWRALIEEKLARAQEGRWPYGVTPLVVTAVRELAPGWVEYRLRHGQARDLLPFRGGEHLPLLWRDADGSVTVSRCALSSSCFDLSEYGIAVARGAVGAGADATLPGELATRLPRELAPGDRLYAAAPRGDFSMDFLAHTTTDLCCVVQGGSFAALVPLLEEAHKTRPGLNVRVCHVGTVAEREALASRLRACGVTYRVSPLGDDWLVALEEAPRAVPRFVTGSRAFVEAARPRSGQVAAYYWASFAEVA